MRKYIILSVNQNVDYLYFMPLTIWTWKRIGWEPIVFYRGEKNELSDLALQKASVVRMLKPIDGIRDATIAQVSRLYGACIGVEEDDYLMLGDCDMLALSDHWKPDASKVTVYNHDLTGFGEIPMCYVGAPKRLWKTLMNLDSQIDYNKAIKRDIENYNNAYSEDFYKWWGVDQQILTERIKQFGTGNIDFINRGQGSHGYARGRVDRANGGWVFNQPELIDAHLMQQTHHSEEKISKLFDLLIYVWHDENWDWFSDYTGRFKLLAYGK